MLEQKKRMAGPTESPIETKGIVETKGITETKGIVETKDITETKDIAEAKGITETKDKREGKTDKGVVTTFQLAQELCHFLEAKKAEEVLLIDLKQVNPYFEYFLIATASASLHLASITQELCKTFRQYFPRSIRMASHKEIESGWVALDMINIVIHLFLADKRRFYNLERLWGDAELLYPITKNRPDDAGKRQ